IDTLPRPLSTSARKRSDRPESAASCLRVMPRRARHARTLAPSSTRTAFGSWSFIGRLRLRLLLFAPDQGCSMLPTNLLSSSLLQAQNVAPSAWRRYHARRAGSPGLINTGDDRHAP